MKTYSGTEKLEAASLRYNLGYNTVIDKLEVEYKRSIEDLLLKPLSNETALTLLAEWRAASKIINYLKEVPNEFKMALQENMTPEDLEAAIQMSQLAAPGNSEALKLAELYSKDETVN